MTVATVAAFLLPLLVAAGIWLLERRRRRVAAALGDARLLPTLAPELARAPRVRYALLLGAGLALAAALADPRWGDAVDPIETTAGTVALVLDASNSMLARDAAPTRLAAERAAARAVVRALPGAAVGIVVFAGRAYAVAPPTVDPGAVELYLDALDPQMVTQTGTAFTGAIRQGLAMLLGGRGEGGALVLITDGDSGEPAAAVEEVAELASRAGIRVYALGVGSEAGATVPDVDFSTGRVMGVKRTQSGETAVSRLRPEPLARLAEVSGGEYAALSDPAGVERVIRAVREGGGGEAGAERGSERPARYGWFAGAALLLLLAEGALRRGVRSPASAIAILTLAASCAPADPLADVERGELEAAAIGYERAIAATPRSPIAQYGLGTVRLIQARYEDARPHLEAARAASDSAVRQAAYYNLGNTHLEPAFAGSAGPDRAEGLGRAIVAYKRALLLNPADEDAKWNLELARRLLEEERRNPRPNPSAGGGGGGGGENDRRSGADNPTPNPAEGGGPSPSVSRAAAERILQSAETRELGIQREKLRRAQPPSPTAHQ